MFNYIAYFKYIIKHKWYIFKAAKQTKASLLRVLLHDLSKFLPSEWFAYMNTYYNKDGSKKKFKHNRAFDVAWTKHLERNKHHWQYWCVNKEYNLCSEMPEEYIREMIADWIGADLAINGKNDAYSWYYKNKFKIKLTPYSRQLVEQILEEIK